MEVVLSKINEKRLKKVNKTIDEILDEYFSFHSKNEYIIIEKFAEKMIELKTFTKMDLREAKIINNNKFKFFIDKNYKKIIDLIKERGYELIKKTGANNTQLFTVK